ncbi:MAG: DUF3365 domain-containing protein [Aromatoleum sp.]|jgi:hypothetical protein|uniref:Tll0287-like domain-containing protein n=1 Tax=Aromatoleum sp. TaxID=2307007 RepID=UPI002895AA4B|nr:DUF3365 domain-containing protein [Aromatoleum sp.]MDT3669235.1 DUF3365 domain-containing protein [Aromatoleum sp.]
MNVRRFVPAALSCLILSAHAADDPMLLEARAAATTLPPKLLTALNDEIARVGPEGAIPVCKDLAPAMAKEIAASSGWRLKRVSLKPRNAERATPDAWEKAALEEFDRRAAAGEPPATLEKGEVIDTADGRVYRYAKALPTQALCLNCHGPQESLKPEVRAAIAEHYPNDRAVGYKEGEIRGAIVATKPL